MTVKAACYKHRPVGSIEALARCLRTSADTLTAVADASDSLYRVADRLIKADGTQRVVYEAREPLKSLQGRILNIFRDAEYPSYLMGGLPNRGCIRGYIENAQRHAGAALLVQEDITNFFPTVTTAQVRRVFLHVFKFPQPVASMLAKLCTRHGTLTQGASPSSYLANLVLHQSEPELVRELESAGLRYSRLIDDITVSSAQLAQRHIVKKAVEGVRRLVERQGFQVNRTKQEVGGRGAHRRIHRLNVAGSRATLTQQERKRIRTSVRELEWRADAGGDRETFYRDWQRAMGRSGRLEALHPTEGARLKLRLRVVRAQRLLLESRPSSHR
jgi:hypothetical protein